MYRQLCPALRSSLWVWHCPSTAAKVCGHDLLRWCPEDGLTTVCSVVPVGSIIVLCYALYTIIRGKVIQSMWVQCHRSDCRYRYYHTISSRVNHIVNPGVIFKIINDRLSQTGGILRNELMEQDQVLVPHPCHCNRGDITDIQLFLVGKSSALIPPIWF